jgi:hypothetical protein
LSHKGRGENPSPKPKNYFERKDFTMKKFFDFVLFLLTGKGDFANEAIEAGVISYEGQGRDKYGK